MKNYIHELYKQNSSIDLLTRLNEQNKLSGAIGLFTKQLEDEFEFYTEKDEYSTRVETGWTYTRVQFTDYTYIKYIHRKRDGHTSFEDASEKWRKYLVSHLQGAEKEKYLQGLQQFADKMSESIKSYILQSVQVGQSQYDLIELADDDRLIKKEIEKAKTIDEMVDEDIDVLDKNSDKLKTMVLKPGVTDKEIEQALESIKHHDTEDGKLL